MRKRACTVFTLLAFAFLLGSCETTTPAGQGGLALTPVQGKVEAREFPEIQLITTKGETYTGKLVELEGDQVLLRPLPYWNIEPVRIPVEEIFSIKLDKKVSSVGNGFLTGFGLTFIVVGVLAGSNSKYNEDYSHALSGSFGAGVFGGLIGLAAAGIIKLSTKSKYEFYNLTQLQKMDVLRDIMGF